MVTVSKALKAWFVFHFVADISFALPLLILPEWFLAALGWTIVDPFTARLVAAALFGIGIESYLSRNASPDSYRSMLDLKIIWSTAAVVAMVLTVWQYPSFRIIPAFLFIAVFAVFNAVWTYWRIRLGRAP